MHSTARTRSNTALAKGSRQASPCTKCTAFPGRGNTTAAARGLALIDVDPVQADGGKRLIQIRQRAADAAAGVQDRMPRSDRSGSEQTVAKPVRSARKILNGAIRRLGILPKAPVQMAAERMQEIAVVVLQALENDVAIGQAADRLDCCFLGCHFLGCHFLGCHGNAPASDEIPLSGRWRGRQAVLPRTLV